MTLSARRRPHVTTSLLADRRRRTGVATVHGTFGELMQGYRQRDGGEFEHFLFTLPVQELSATSTVTLATGGGAEVQPADRTRALTAAADLARTLGLTDTGISVTIDSNIPVGKGCASSTADIMASVAALVGATHPEVPPPVVRALGSLVARDLEWGDYVFSDAITLCLQRTHTPVRRYETDLRWRILGVDEQGTVDTAEFHRTHKESRRLAHHYDRLLTELDVALRLNDYEEAAEIATESATINQRVLPKRTFSTMRRIARSTGALGLCVAHTGTVVGLIFSAHQSDCSLRMWEAGQCLRREGLTGTVYTVREPAG